ncbi:SprT family zinc-dependent metalloprotease [Streptomyces sp. AgN23]|uniref:M48 family metallopeptidase n=1 Tax=Streptomyces sp. AgN23 TaxID=1188315 RepID=UPI001FF2D170|nr:SprT family zinc-dependent metalloprotease [Streptomyces sp. AgN23]WTB05362.1 M48 family metallopeptidase [Streptomyces antimycoticus]
MSDANPSSPADSSCLTDGQTLWVDGRALEVRISARRSRLGLTVERDGALILRVPPTCPPERAEAFVRSGSRWIDDKLRLREERQPLHPTRKLSDGEIHRYLGRDYRLLYVDEPGAPVRLVAGRLRMDQATAADPVRGRRALADWYTRSGLRWARGRLQPWAARMDVDEPRIEVRDVGRRWGTHRPGRIALHWATFQLPFHLIDYVIAHELAHVRVSGHGPDYWRLLRRAMPECARWKTELDEMGRRVWMGDVTER